GGDGGLRPWGGGAPPASLCAGSFDVVRAPLPPPVLEVGIRRRQAQRLPDALPGAGQRVTAAGSLSALRLGDRLSESRGRAARPARERPPVRLAGGRHGMAG